MKPVATLLCLCVVQSSCEGTYINGNKHTMANSGRLLGFDLAKAGELIMWAPQMALDAVANSKQYVKNAAESMAKRVTNELAKGLDSVHARKYVPMMIYSVLNLISRTMGPIMRALHMDCVRMRRMKHNVGTSVVDHLETSDCYVCGVLELEAINNVTLTQEGDSFMVISVPYFIKFIVAEINAVNVSDGSGFLLENTPAKLTIKDTLVNAKVFFTTGILWKFFTIQFRVRKFGQFDLTFNLKTEDRTPAMDMVEGISDVIAHEVAKSINDKLEQLEKRLSAIVTFESSN